MPKYSMAFSLNGELIVEAEDDQKASALLQRAMETDHFNPRGLSYEEFDCEEVDEGKAVEITEEFVEKLEGVEPSLEYEQLKLDLGEDFR